MRHFIIICFIPFFCLGQANKTIDDQIPLDTISYELSQKTDNYDSLHFHITRFYYPSGQLAFDGISDTITGLGYDKYFMPDGRIDAHGAMNDVKRFHIGPWTYLLPSGDYKVINFDSSYQKALQIAKTYGYDKGRIEVNEELHDRVYYWQVINWTQESNGGGQGKYILIRRSTGQVTIPKNNDIEYIE